MSAALYAEANPDELLCLAPISVTINYELLKQTQKEEYWDDWRTKGYVEEASKSKPGMVMRIGWGLMEDIKKHDLLKGANKLTMPVLLMAGTNDKDTPYSQQEVLFAAIPGSKKKLVKVKNADHSFRDSGDDAQKLEEVKGIICAWLKAVVSTNSS
jgi:pimeloyl-ACP methyl ester carboxylesterase